MLWINWSAHLDAILDRHAPIKSRRIKGNRPPWITTELENAIRTRDSIARLPKTPENRIKLKTQRNLVTKLKRKQMHTFFSNSLQSDPRKFHRLLQRITGIGKNKEASIQPLLEDHRLVTSSKNQANVNAKYFETNIQPAPDLSKAELEGHNSLLSIKSKQYKSFSFRCTTDAEVRNIVSNLNNNKATGHDQISVKLLKLILPALTPAITDVFNHFIVISEIPHCWKFGSVVPIFKKGNPAYKENYRPITVLTHISKVFEKILVRQLKEHFRGIFPTDMHGYMKGLSTETALIKLQQDCINALDQQKSTVIASLDLSKAFDSVHYDLLLEKLRGYGLSPAACNLVRDYLSGRTQVVKVRDSISQSFPKIRGVPQGSVLGPFLFNVYVADLSKFIRHSSLIRYADDITMYFSSDCIDEAIRSLNEDLSVTSDWLKSNFLTLNALKSQVMIVKSTTASHTSPSIDISVDSIPITCSSSINLLGVPFDNQLTMKQHLKERLRKANLCLYQLRQFRTAFSPMLSTQLYKSYIQPHLEYCTCLMTPLYHSQLIKLDQLQSRALRVLYKTHSREEKFSIPSHNKPNLRLRRTIRTLSITHTALHSSEKNQINQILTRTHTKYCNRQTIKLEVPKHRTALKRCSFQAVSARLWNFLPPKIKAYNAKHFTAKLKTYLSENDWKTNYVLDSISYRTL